MNSVCLHHEAVLFFRVRLGLVKFQSRREETEISLDVARFFIHLPTLSIHCIELILNSLGKLLTFLLVPHLLAKLLLDSICCWSVKMRYQISRSRPFNQHFVLVKLVSFLVKFLLDCENVLSEEPESLVLTLHSLSSCHLQWYWCLFALLFGLRKTFKLSFQSESIISWRGTLFDEEITVDFGFQCLRRV